MRRPVVAVLAVPVIASIYFALLLARPARRYLAATIAVVLVGAVGVGLAAPAPASSIPPSTPGPVSAALMHPVETVPGEEGPAAAVAASPIATATNAPAASGPGLERTPAVGTSQPDVVTSPTPRGASLVGSTPRAPTTATVAGSHVVGNRIKPDSNVVLRFARPVTLAAVRAAFVIRPAVKGVIRAVSNRLFTFIPAQSLAANTSYAITFAKTIRDTDGVAVVVPKVTRVLTVTAPKLVRFRPARGLTDVDPTAAISVRFTKAMNRSTTARAFSVVVGGKRVTGKITWAEDDTVLVFTPAKPLAEGVGIGVRVLTTATSADGARLTTGGSATFRTTAPAESTTAKVSPKPITRPPSGRGALGGGSWAAAEAYYLKLMNCTRTGGWVTSGGACSGGGTRHVAPLWIDAGISARVSRPYAKYLAATGICSHFADGNPGNRLHRAGYSSSTWAENISCPHSESVMDLMVATQRFFQDEKPYLGGHYVNLMNAAYDRVGIGVWVVNGRAEVVIDFYRP